jgi:two-component system OmpR family sensor kinase
MHSWARRYWLEIAWVAFAAVNVTITLRLIEYETVPFHFVWISLTLMYGYRIWRLRSALGVLALVCLATGGALLWVVLSGPRGPDELTEVPLMGAVFLGMVWHVERRQAAMKEVERAAAREREFVRAASHHLKTPIAIARGLAALIRSERASAMSAGDLDDLIEELDRLAGLAEDLLLLAAAEQPDNLLRREIDFEDLIVDAAARRWSRTADRRWTISPADGTLHADRQRLDVVLDALIENAVRATDVGDRIVVTGRVDGDVAVIEVSDSGVGIEPDALPYVFERFWSKSVPADAPRGTGLGLPIARALVEAHGGTIAIASAAGKGTTVTVRLPGIRAAAAAYADVLAAGGAATVG